MLQAGRGGRVHQLRVVGEIACFRQLQLSSSHGLSILTVEPTSLLPKNKEAPGNCLQAVAQATMQTRSWGLSPLG